MSMSEPQPQPDFVDDDNVVVLEEVKKQKGQGVEDDEEAVEEEVIPAKPASAVLEEIHAESIATADVLFPKVIEQSRIMHPSEICRDVRPTLRLDDRVLEAVSKKLGVDEIEHVLARVQTQLELADLLKSHDTMIGMVNKIANIIGLKVQIDGVEIDFKQATPIPVQATIKALIYIQCRTTQLEDRWMNFERIEKDLRERLNHVGNIRDELESKLRELSGELAQYESVQMQEKARPTRGINPADDFKHHVLCSRATDEYIRIKMKEDGDGTKIADIPRNKIIIVRSMAEASRLTEKRANLLLKRLPRIHRRDANRFTVAKLILQMAD